MVPGSNVIKNEHITSNYLFNASVFLIEFCDLIDNFEVNFESMEFNNKTLDDSIKDFA